MNDSFKLSQPACAIVPKLGVYLLPFHRCLQTLPAKDSNAQAVTMAPVATQDPEYSRTHKISCIETSLCQYEDRVQVDMCMGYCHEPLVQI